MFALASSDALTTADPAALKRAPSSLPSCLALLDTPTASSWSPDNASLYIASAGSIHKYDPSSNTLRDIYSSEEPQPISHLLAKDKSSLIFSAGEKICILECGASAKVAQVLTSHKSTITSLSLSNDSTLLASTSSDAAHVHNLSLGSHTVLRGLPLAGQHISASAFHPHTRTRLLLGIGKQLAVYDTTRPSAPLKTIPMHESSSGDITAIACSPFSKTLIAIASTGGSVALVDLDKEKGLFRTLNVKVPLTSVVFSPEGASIYLGTENGRLLILDLRSLDKPPKSIVISESGSRIETMSIQKKIKGSPDSSKPATTTASTRSSLAPAANPAPKPSPAKVARVGVGLPAPAPARRIPSSLKAHPAGAATPRRSTASDVKKKAFSPVRDPLGNSMSGNDLSVQIETLSALRGGLKKDSVKATPIKDPKNARPSLSRDSRPPRTPQAESAASASTAKPTSSAATTRLSTKSKPSPPISTSPKDPQPPRRTRVLSTTRTRKPSTAEPGADVASAALGAQKDPSSHPVVGRPRAASSASRAGSDVASGLSGTRSARSTRSTTSRPGSSASSVPPVPPIPASFLAKAAEHRLSASRTPSPDLPDMHGGADPVTPVPAAKRQGMGVLGLGTPEVDAWIRAGDVREVELKDRKGKGKSVGFKDHDEAEEGESEQGSEGSDEDDNAGGQDDVDDEDDQEREKSLTMQVSPRRPTPHRSSSSWAPSPLRHSSHTSHSPHTSIPASPGGSSAQELLRTIVRDIMFDYQAETQQAMTGLHLDLVRMGRGWKRELRDVMGEYVGDLKDLREENRRLREENEMLRRGY